MKRIALMSACCFLLLGLSSPAFAIDVQEAAVTTAVSDRSPVDAVQTIPVGVGKLYFFTHVVGAQGEQVITHVWLREGTEMARVELPVLSPDYRTWSVKSFRPEWTGNWVVEARNAEGKVLSSVPFTLN